MWRAWLAGRAGSQGRGHAIARRRPSWVSLGPQADYVSAGDAIVPPLTSVLGHARVLPTARAVPSRFRAPQSFSWTGTEMSNLPTYEMLAQAFAREGVDTLFSLMGDGNMHWATAMSKIAGMRVFHVRHEHCACGMAMGYHSATGKVGVATVTCGPGVTQITTALTTASRAGVPMVVFAGESPINARWYNQALDQAPLVTATGAHYVRAHSAARMYDSVREAFYVARYERRPAVLGVPYDLQKLPLPGAPEYLSSSSLVPETGRTPPNPDMLGRLVERLAGAQRPIIIAGRGAVRS